MCQKQVKHAAILLKGFTIDGFVFDIYCTINYNIFIPNFLNIWQYYRGNINNEIADYAGIIPSLNLLPYCYTKQPDIYTCIFIFCEINIYIILC